MGIHMIAPHLPLAKLIKETFYPDADPESTSVDGLVGSDARLTFSGLRVVFGSVVGDSGLETAAGFHSFDTGDLWSYMRRAILLFDTSNIPSGRVIKVATLTVVGSYKRDQLGVNPALTVVSSAPASNTELVLADYGCLGEIALSDEISYADFVLEANNILTLNLAGRNAIAKGGITKLGVREANYELPNITPAWSANEFSDFGFYTAEKGIVDSVDYRPKLTITYQT